MITSPDVEISLTRKCLLDLAFAIIDIGTPPDYIRQRAPVQSTRHSEPYVLSSSYADPFGYDDYYPATPERTPFPEVTALVSGVSCVFPMGSLKPEDKA